MTCHLQFAALALAATLTCSARADDAVTDSLQAAYAPYRAALFRTNGKSQADAQQAMSQAQTAWKALTERFAGQPPAPYDRDRAFGSTLTQVAQVYDKAAAEIAAGKLPEAHETLEQARDLMSALRQRNGVVVFSDHMNAYHAEMEHLLIDGPKLLTQPDGLPQLVAQAGVIDYLARQLRAKAPPVLLQNAEFEALLKDVEASVRAVRQAALKQDAAALKESIGKVKQPYSRLFAKFG